MLAQPHPTLSSDEEDAPQPHANPDELSPTFFVIPARNALAKSFMFGVVGYGGNVSRLIR